LAACKLSDYLREGHDFSAYNCKSGVEMPKYDMPDDDMLADGMPEDDMPEDNEVASPMIKDKLSLEGTLLLK